MGRGHPALFIGACVRRFLVLGIGNTLLGDEGFGVHAINWLQQNYAWPDNVRLVDGATGGLMLMADLMDCDVAIVLDIAMCGQKPGTVILIEDDDIDLNPDIGQSMHQAGLSNILASCELAGHRPKTLIFGFEPWDCQTVSAGLTPQAATALPEYCEKVVGELAKMGIKAIRT